MKINFIEWSNFNSYGKNIQRLDFGSSGELSLISASNGSGKSSILEVIIFALYGQIIGKKNKDLVNRMNKNLYVKINFESNGKLIEIERRLLPDKFEISINGNNDISEIAGKRNVQDYIEKEIIKIPIQVFINTIIINVDRFKSFLKMSSNDKRNIIDNIFNLDFINKMLELHRNNFNEFKREIKNVEIRVEMFQKMLDNKKTELGEFEKKTLSINNEKINSFNKEKKSNLLSMGVFEENERKLKTKSEELKNILENLKNENITNKHEIKELEKKINIFNADICPMCGTKLDNDFHLENKKKYSQELVLAKIRNATDKLDYEKIYKEFDEINELLKKEKLEYQKLYTRNRDIDYEIKIEEQKSGNNQTIGILKKNISELEVDLNGEFLILEQYNKDKNFYYSIDNILDENGFKKVLFNNLLPLLNKEIFQFTKILNLNYIIKINNKFDVEITHLWQNIEPRTLSSGEEKKINLIILFSIIRLLKLKMSNLNVLFLDEIFVNLDQTTQNHLTEILYKISKKMNLDIYIINHTDLQAGYFDKNIFIEKINGFSEISISKNI